MTEVLQWAVVDCYGPFGRGPNVHVATSAQEAAERWCDSDANTV